MENVNVEGISISVPQLESEKTAEEIGKTEEAPGDDENQEKGSDAALTGGENEEIKKVSEDSANASGGPSTENAAVEGAAAESAAVSNPEGEKGTTESQQGTEPPAAGEGQDLTDADKLDNIPEGEEEEFDEEEDEVELLFVKPPPKYDGPRKIHISRPFLTSFEYAPKLQPEEGTGIVSYKNNLGLLLTRQHTSITNQQHTRQSYPPVAPCSGIGSRVHRHRSGIATAEVRMSDFFDKGRITKLGE